MQLRPQLHDHEVGLHPSKYEIHSDTDRIDVFQIRVFCRIVGGTAYDVSEPHKATQVTYHWRQPGFKEEAKYKEITKQLPAVKIED